MIVLDTTVLIYAVGSAHHFREPCRALVKAISEGVLAATTTAEVIQEFVHVRARRRGRDDARALGLDYAELLSPLLAIGEDQLRSGLSLFEANPRLGAFDSVLAAAAEAVGATGLVSADSAFAELRGVRHLVPDAEGVGSLLDDAG